MKKTRQFDDFCNAKSVHLLYYLLMYKTREIPVISNRVFFLFFSQKFEFSLIAVSGHICSLKTFNLESRERVYSEVPNKQVLA